jgi:psiF repeat-containing protein
VAEQGKGVGEWACSATAFMSQCLKGGAVTRMTQQAKMKKCNADASAKALKGDERQAFMSTCLKADKKM